MELTTNTMISVHYYKYQFPFLSHGKKTKEREIQSTGLLPFIKASDECADN